MFHLKGSLLWRRQRGELSDISQTNKLMNKSIMSCRYIMLNYQSCNCASGQSRNEWFKFRSKLEVELLKRTRYFEQNWNFNLNELKVRFQISKIIGTPKTWYTQLFRLYSSLDSENVYNWVHCGQFGDLDKFRRKWPAVGIWDMEGSKRYGCRWPK